MKKNSEQKLTNGKKPVLNKAVVLRRFSDEIKYKRGIKEFNYAQVLGFSEPYYAQMAMHDYRHLIGFHSVVPVIDWLRSQGWDLVKMA